jgi:hypothetical protein
MLASKIGNTIRLLQGMMRMTSSFVGIEAKEKLTIAKGWPRVCQPLWDKWQGGRHGQWLKKQKHALSIAITSAKVTEFAVQSRR